MRHARSIAMECVVVTRPADDSGHEPTAADGAVNSEEGHPHSGRAKVVDCGPRAVVRPAVMVARDDLRYEWDCPCPVNDSAAASPQTDDELGAATLDDANAVLGDDAVAVTTPQTHGASNDDATPTDVEDVLDVSAVSAASDGVPLDGAAALASTMDASFDGGVPSSMVLGQGGAVRVAAKLRRSGSKIQSTAAPTHGSRGTIIATSTKDVHWSLLDAWTEASIFDGVPEEALKPLVKPLRSEKATLLLEGYLSAADKRALRSTQGPALAHDPADATGSGRVAAHSFHVSDDSDAAADPLHAFYAAEDALERRRFVGEHWLDKITLFQSLLAWQGLLHRHYRRKPTSDVLTDAVQFGLRRWRARARQSALVRTAMCHKPPASRLKTTCTMLADWPLACIEALLAAGRPAVYAAGDAVFHEGDPTEDVFVVCDGEVRATVMRGARSRGRYFVGAYEAAKHNDGRGFASVGHHSKRRLNPPVSSDDAAVVGYVLHGMLFGMDSLLTKAPRCYTAWCTKPSCLLRIRRADVYLAMSPVPGLTRDVMHDAAWRERHQYIFGTTFPIPTDIFVVASPVFEHWHTSALQQLMSLATIRVVYKGAVLCTQGEVAPVGAAEMCLVLQGKLERVVAGYDAVPMGPMEVFGEEEGILCAFPCRQTVRALETTQVLTIRQEDYLSVVREHGDCGSYARRAIATRMASRLVQPTHCPEALLHDPLMRFLLPDHVLTKLWRDYAEPVFLLQGDGVFRTWDEADYMYLFVSGTLFQQYGADGPHIPVVSLGELLSGGDDAVHHAQADMQDEDELYNAMNSPGAYVKGLSRGSAAVSSGGARNELPNSGGGGPHVWVPLERNLITTEEHLGGVFVGGVELALQRKHCLSHLRTTSNVVAWRWHRKRVEAMLRDEHPAVWMAMSLAQTKEVVQRHFLGMSLRQLKDEAAPRSAELS